VQKPIDTEYYRQEYQEFYRVKQHKTVCKSTKKNWNRTVLSCKYQNRRFRSSLIGDSDCTKSRYNSAVAGVRVEIRWR
jgi:hypothetical protein